jgi:hypothetical protein
MSFPGDQQQPGGWASPQPPQSPYGPGDDQTGHGGSPYGGGSFDDRYDEPYGSHDEGYGPGGFGGPGDHGNQGGVGPGGPGGSFGNEQADPYGGGFGAPGGPGGQGGPFGAERPGPYGGGFEGGPPFGGEHQDPYGGGPGGYDPAGEPGDGPRSGRDNKRLLVSLAVAAGILLVGGGTAFALAGGGGDKPKPAAAPTSVAPTPTPSPTPTATETGRGERLQSRATDPRPLTLNEVFKARTFKAGGRKYYMTGRRSEHKCSPPTHGVKFRKALAKGGCTQVLRATFSNGRFIGTIGVLNLRTQAAAEAAQVASRQKDAFILALPGAGTTKKIGQGLSLTTAEVDGHYLIMSWVQYPNGKKIASKDYSGVTSFVKATTYGSNLRTALNYRSMEGKPS